MKIKTPEFINKIFEYLKKKDNIFEKQIDNSLDYFGSYYKYIIILLNILYILLFFGLLSINYIYINYLNIFIQLFTAIFLLLRFHPYRKHFITKYDSIIISHCAIFLLINLSPVCTCNKYVPCAKADKSNSSLNKFPVN